MDDDQHSMSHDRDLGPLMTPEVVSQVEIWASGDLSSVHLCRACRAPFSIRSVREGVGTWCKPGPTKVWYGRENSIAQRRSVAVICAICHEAQREVSVLPFQHCQSAIAPSFTSVVNTITESLPPQPQTIPVSIQQHPQQPILFMHFTPSSGGRSCGA